MKVISTCLTAFASVSLLSLTSSPPANSNDWTSSSLTSTKLGRPGGGGAARSLRVQNYQRASNSRQAVLQLFEQYKSLDLTNNLQIMNLYANNAAIDVLGTKYDKASYRRFIAGAYQNSASDLNRHTVYGEPNVRVMNDSAQVSFAGALGPNTMYVYWNLRRNPAGVWQITSERFTKPAMSLTRANLAHSMSMTPTNPAAAVNASNPWLDSIKQMNENPDTKAFFERMKKMREQQNH